MSEKGILFTILIAVLYVGLMTFVITRAAVQQSERNWACIAVGYESYDVRHKACSEGSNPIVLYPYEEAFDRKVE